MAKRTKRPLVSVVIPTYNRANDLRRCLDSLKRQTIDEFEVLVCDDGSTDGTSEVWEEYSESLDLTYDRAENFGGPARPRNRGIALSRAPYVALLDSDDWWVPEKLEISLKWMDAGADLVYHDLYFATASYDKHLWRRARTRELTAPVFRDLLVNGSGITNSSVVVRKSLLDKIGGFSEDRDLIAAEDYDAWVRIAKHTDKFQRIPKPLGYYWTGGGNISNPSRILRILDAIETRYSTELREFEASQHIHWIKYARARALMNLRSYEQAKLNFGLIRREGTPLSIYVRSKLAWMWMGVQR